MWAVRRIFPVPPIAALDYPRHAFAFFGRDRFNANPVKKEA
jgi:hypothetical protein